MKTALFLGLFFITNYFFCQSGYEFALVNDTEGYVNIRKSPKVSDNIIDSLKNDFPVFISHDDGNWYEVVYLKNNSLQYGFIYKDKFKYISQYDKFKLKMFSDSKCVLTKDSLKFILTTEPFNTTSNKIVYSNEEGYERIKTINGKRFWGTDYGMPSVQYGKIEFYINDLKIDFPKTEYDNYFQPNLEFTKAYYDAENKRIFLIISNGDGAGSYEVLWCFENGKLLFYSLMGSL